MLYLPSFPIVPRQAVSLPKIAQIPNCGFSSSPWRDKIPSLMSGYLKKSDIKLRLFRERGIAWDLLHIICCSVVLLDERPLSHYKICQGATSHLVERSFSARQGVTQPRSPEFCAGSPWGQVDVKLAKICRLYCEKKFAILKHRHRSWLE